MRNLAPLLTSLIAFAGCAKAPPAPGPAGATAPAKIALVSFEKKPVTRTVEQPGAVYPFEETELFAKIPGYVRLLANDPTKADKPPHDRLIDLGSRVKKDQVLAELGVPELDEEYGQKESLVKQAEAEVVQARKALAATTAGVTAAQALVTEAKAGLSRQQALYDRWESEAARVSRLVSGGVIDSQSKDETLNQFRAAEAGRAEAVAKVVSAEAGVAKAEADREKSVADVTAAEARREVATSDVRRVGALQGYLKLKAPFDGIVTRRAVNTGDYVSADGKHGLFTVARIDPVRIVINVPEADAGLVTVGQEVKLSFPAVAGPVTTGTVTRTSWSLDPGSRTLRVEVDTPNPDGAVRPGAYVYAKLTASLPAGWAVPAAAVGKVNDEPVVYLVENGKAVKAVVQLAKGDAQFTQIRKYKKASISEWAVVTGQETVASPASAVTDGQSVP